MLDPLTDMSAQTLSEKKMIGQMDHPQLSTPTSQVIFGKGHKKLNI